MLKSIMTSCAFAGSIPELAVTMMFWRKSFFTMSETFTPVAAERSLSVNGAEIFTVPPETAALCARSPGVCAWRSFMS